ncbi:MAG: hypothetical protein LBE06_00630 [Azoarcus sp.]|jgi:hypothetical protein|nr:hypothetical protein [Azoarcus sp.]
MKILAWILLILLIAGLVVGGFLYIRAQMREEKKQGGSGTLFSRNKGEPVRLFAYRAVELQLCVDPCEVGISIAGKRLLRENTPALPLPGCKRKECECSYVQHDDRRSSQPRRDMSLYGVSISKARQGEERRKKGLLGRRKMDKPKPIQER